MQDKIQADLKAAMLARRSIEVDVLKGLKSAIHSSEIDNKRKLKEAEIIKIVQKEVKKRQEAADLYEQASDQERKEKELAEAKILTKYLPKQLSDEGLATVVSKIIKKNNIDSPQKMGMVIGMVNKEVGASAEGAKIAAEVKKQLGV